MGTATLWMVMTVVLLAAVIVATLEETARRRAACIRFEHELRRGVYHPVRTATPAQHLRVARPRHRAAA